MGELREGDRLADRYTLGATIGRGGYGRVFRAHDARGGPDVAIKVLHHADAPSILRFEREAAIVRRLASPHTVRLLDHGVGPTGPFMVLELLEGTSLSAVLLRRRTLPPAFALAITAQVLRSLHEAHALGVVHRDIKPGNLFLTSARDDGPFVKVLDFGIAKQRGAVGLTVQGELLGTPHYMAPEQLTGAGVDARTDLYALGLVLAEMVSGRLVMGRGGTRTILARLAQRGPVPLEDDVVESIVGAIVEQAVDKDPAARFQTAAEMLEAVSATAAQLPARGGAEVPTGTPTWFAPHAVAPTAAGPTAVGPTAAGPTAVAPHPTVSGAPIVNAHLPPPQIPATIRPPSAVGAAASGVARARRRGILATVAVAIAIAIAIAVGVHVGAVVPGASDLAGRSAPTNVPEAKSADPAEIRSLLVAAGYTINSDTPSPGAHTFSMIKRPCVGSVILVKAVSESMARRSAQAGNATGLGTAYLVHGDHFVSVTVVREETGRVDAPCTAPAVALLTR